MKQIKVKATYLTLAGLLLWLCSGCSTLTAKTDYPNWNAADLSTMPPCVDDDCNCGDFRDQSLAQAVLEAFPHDPFVLDRDANGVACETLPLPSTPSSEAGAELTAPAAETVHLLLGNPTNASRDSLDNYLLVRSQYALSYNSGRGLANWVSWQLNREWLGTVERQNNFRQDGGLPKGVYQVTPNDYRNSGYDRGHIVPSGDRTRSVQDNSATFLMTNNLPQAPDNNRGVWRELEEYSRSLVKDLDYTLYILSGGYGAQGELADGRITIPSRLWKIVVILGAESDASDPNDMGMATTVIAVDMPNRDGVEADWQAYRTTVDRIEIATGYDFLSALDSDVEIVLEATLGSLPID